METKPLPMTELKDDFYSLKSNKYPGYGAIGYKVIKNALGVCVNL